MTALPKLWTVGWNMPGYLPEADVETFVSHDDARASLIETLNRAADSAETWADEHDCDDIPCPTYGDDCPWQEANALSLLAEDVNLSRGDFYGVVGNMAYWITETTYADAAPEVLTETLDGDLHVVRFGWPGGYRVWYLVDDGESLCAECVQDNIGEIVGSFPNTGWTVVGHYTEADTDDPGPCAHCGRTADISES